MVVVDCKTSWLALKLETRIGSTNVRRRSPVFILRAKVLRPVDVWSKVTMLAEIAKTAETPIF